MISIIIPNFNRSKYLKQAIQSVMEQSFQEWELLVVDDGSTDDSESIVNLLAKKDDRINWIPRDGNLKGAPVCRNIGLFTARNDFVIFLDSDDLLAPHCLKQRMLAMQNAMFDFAVFPMLLFYQKPEGAKYLWNIETEEDDVDRFLRLDAVWQTSGPIWRKQFLINLGGFDERLHCWQDVDLHIRALLAKPKYKKLYEYSPDCYYRSENMTSLSRSINSPEKLTSRFLILQKIAILTENRNQVKALNSNILTATLNVGNWSFFMRILYWSFQNSIFSFFELIDFVKLAIIKFTKIYRIGYFSKIYEKLNKQYNPTNTQGKILVNNNKY